MIFTAIGKSGDVAGIGTMSPGTETMLLITGVEENSLNRPLGITEMSVGMSTRNQLSDVPAEDQGESLESMVRVNPV